MLGLSTTLQGKPQTQNYLLDNTKQISSVRMRVCLCEHACVHVHFGFGFKRKNKKLGE